MESLRSIGTPALIGLLSSYVGLLGCGGPGPPESASPPPQRIIALAPSAAEILFALGLGDRVVGVGDYVAFPPEAEDKTRVGGLFDVRLEVVASLEPDLAVLLPSEETLRDQMERLDVAVVEVASDTLEDFDGAVRAIADRCAVPQRGEDLLRDFWRDLEPRRAVTSPLVALTLGREPGRLARVLVAGPGSYLDELLTRAGATNAFADAGTAYPEVGLEEMIRRDPDVILELRSTATDSTRLFADWAASPMIGAVERGCLEVVVGDHTMIPGPRLPRLYREMIEALERCEVS